MRIALKHQILLAPTVILCLMTGLLLFLQFTYWDLSVQRRTAKELGNAYVALSGTDLSLQKLQAIVQHISRDQTIDLSKIQELNELYDSIEGSITEVTHYLGSSGEQIGLILEALDAINPKGGLRLEGSRDSFGLLRLQVASLAEQLNEKRQLLKLSRERDIDELVARTTFVAMIVLAAAILVGIFFSLFFARNLLRRIGIIARGAASISLGEYTPLPIPQKIDDELDALALSINRMTDKLIRVVGSEKLLEGAEEERRRIAMELHDQTLADLSSVLRGLQRLDREEDQAGAVQRMEKDLQGVMSDLRDVMENLHPQTLEILGLVPALEGFLEGKMRLPHLPAFHFNGIPRIDEIGLGRLEKLTIYRIACEGVTNIIKHASAERYEVSLDLRGDNIVLVVEDNGRGLPPDIHETATGRGLRNMAERAKAIGGTLEWRASRFVTGTRMELRVPVPNADPGEIS